MMNLTDIFRAAGRFLGLGLLMGLVACGAPTQENVRVSGSSTVLPVLSRAADTYMMDRSDARVIVNAGGSGVGIKQVGDGLVDIGMTSRDLSPEERETYKDAGLTIHAIGRDAVVPVVSSEIFDAGITSLTRAQIAAIYTGEISNWAELGGPDSEIYVIDKETSRGTRQVFMDYVLDDGKARALGADAVLGSNNEEQTAITQSAAAIGMLSHAWLNGDVRGLSIITEEGEVIAPTLENIRAGSYPIVRNLMLVTQAELSPAAHAFLAYVKSEDGQRSVDAAGYIRLTPDVAKN